MVLPVYLYGHPVIRKETEEIDASYPQLKELIENMYETMYAAEGIGLAAPQIGLSIRLIVIDVNPMAEYFPECADVGRRRPGRRAVSDCPVFTSRFPVSRRLG